MDKTTATVLMVPYYEQQGEGADRYDNDCLAACFRMCWGFWRLKNDWTDDLHVTVNDISRIIYKEGKKTLGFISDIKKLRNTRFYIPMRPVSKLPDGLTLENIRQDILAGYPVIALVRYLHLTQNPELDFGHYIVIFGVDGDEFYIHDPLGNIFAGDEDHLHLALTDGGKWFGNSYQGLRFNYD